MDINAKCFLCQVEPCQHAIRVIDNVHNNEGVVALCDGCYYIACGGSDQQVAHLWVGLQEAESAGYTDASFCYGLKKHVKEVFHGFPAIGWARWKDKEGIDCEGAFLLVCVPNPTIPMTPPLWCRSRGPMFPALLRACLDNFPAYQIADDAKWTDGRFIIAPVPEDADKPLYFERNEAVAAAMVKAYYSVWGERDVFRVLANNMTATGYELIRRLIL